MRPLRGIAFKLASVMVFIVMAAMIKATAQHVPAGQTVFFRSFFRCCSRFTTILLSSSKPAAFISSGDDTSTPPVLEVFFILVT